MKRVAWLLAFCILFFSLSGISQARPKCGPVCKTILGEIFIGGMVATDYGITAHYTFVGESNPLLGQQPSIGHVAGVGIGLFAAYSALHLLTIHSQRQSSAGWRAASYLAIPATVGALHGYAIQHNIRVETEK